MVVCTLNHSLCISRFNSKLKYAALSTNLCSSRTKNHRPFYDVYIVSQDLNLLFYRTFTILYYYDIQKKKILHIT